LNQHRVSSGQFQQKCAALLRPELRNGKELERFRVSVKNGNALVCAVLSFRHGFKA
jgi:hypothetical protein